VRINQFLARSGLTSRRGAEELIKSGKVSVNGLVISDLATQIDTNCDSVALDGKTIKLPKHKYFLLNKPVGYTCTKSDPHAARIVFELMPTDDSLISVGRLDRDTTGLLLITNDGDFAQNIIHPSKKIEKEYRVTTEMELTEAMVAKLLDGITLEDGPARAKRVKKLKSKEISLTIEEGRKRIVRRMLSAIGAEVTKLERVRIGEIKLDVELGHYRELTPKEISQYA